MKTEYEFSSRVIDRVELKRNGLGSKTKWLNYSVIKGLRTKIQHSYLELIRVI